MTSSSCACSTRPRSHFTFTTPAMFHDVGIGPRALHRPGCGPRPNILRRFAAHAAEIERACADLGDRIPARSRPTRPLELVLFDLLKARMRRAGSPAGELGPRGGEARDELPHAPVYPGRPGDRGPDRVPPDPPDRREARCRSAP